MLATGHMGSGFESEVVPACSGRYEAVVRNGKIVAIRTADGQAYQDFGPGSDFWSSFVSKTNKRLFVSVRVSRIKARVHINEPPFDSDEVKMIGVGRFAETMEGMGDVFLWPFTVAKVMNLPDDGSGFWVVVPHFGNPSAVSLNELFLISAGTLFGNKFFLYVGEAAQKFLGKVISSSSGQWRTNPETMLRLLSRCGLTDALLENTPAQAHLAFIAGQAGEKLVACGEKIDALEKQLEPLRHEADVLVDAIKLFRTFISK